VRIAFFGLPLAAVLLARDGHDVAYAAACRRAPGLRRLRARIAPGHTSVRPDVGSDATFAAVKSARPDLIVSWFWTTRLPARLLALAPSVGVHPSLLPRHRGPDPYFWTIDAGDEVAGVTAHRLDVEYDTGAILGQRMLRVESGWTSWKLARALDRPSLALLREVVRAYADGRPPAPVAQDESRATLAPEPDDKELAIRWSWPAARIERRVRAAAPAPGAWTEIGETIVVLTRVRVTADFPRVLAAGEAAVRADGTAVVRAGDDALELLEGVDEDGERVLARADLADIVASSKIEEKEEAGRE
jgi:methionyl-tRNA formyltransferase